MSQSARQTATAAAVTTLAQIVKRLFNPLQR